MSLLIAQLAKQKLYKPAVMSTVQKELAADRLRATQIVDTATDLLSYECKALAGDESQRDALITRITQAPDNLEQRLLHDNHRDKALLEARVALENILGTNRQQTLVSRLQINESLADRDAELAMAFAASAMVSTLQTKITEGAGINNAEGFAALFTDQTTPLTQSAASYSADAQSAAAYLTVDDSDQNWWPRYLLPILFLALLLLTTLRFCSDADKKALLSQERDQLQQALNTAQQSAETRAQTIEEVQSDYDATKFQLAELQQTTRAELDALTTKNATTEQLLAQEKSQKERTTAELNQLQTEHEAIESEVEQYRALPTDTVALQQQLLKAKSDREDALGQKTEATTLLKGAQAELQKLLARNESLSNDLELAQQNVSAQQETIAGLKAQLSDVSSERANLTQSLATTQTTLDELQASKNLETTQLQQQNQALETRIGDMLPNLTAANNEVSALNADKARIETALSDANNTIESLQAELRQATEKSALENRALASQLSDAVEARNMADTALGEHLQQVSEQSAQIDGLQLQIAELEEQKTEAENTAKSLQQKVAEADVEKSQSSDQIKTLQLAVEDRDKQITTTGASLNTAQSELATLIEERDALLESRDALNAEIDSLTTKSQSTRDQLTKLDSQQTTINKALETANSDNEQLTGQLVALEAKLQESTDTLNNAESQQASTDLQLQDALAEIDNQQSQLQIATAAAEKQQRQIDELEENLAALKATGQEQSGIIASLEKKNESLRSARISDNKKATKTIAALEQSLMQAGDEVSALTAKGNALQAQITQEKNAAEAVIRATRQMRDDIARQINKAGLTEVTVESVENDTAVAITLGPGNIYRKGVVALSRGGTTTLSKIGNILSGYPQWLVDVEGHTDSTPIGRALRKQYPTNWELSTARASVVVHYLPLVSDLQQDAMSARGYADTRPLASNASAAGRAENRRVDIVLRRRGE